MKKYTVLVKDGYVRDMQVIDALEALNMRKSSIPETPEINSISDIDELLNLFNVSSIEDIEGVDFRDLFSDVVLDYSVDAENMDEALKKTSEVFGIPLLALTAIEIKGDNFDIYDELVECEVFDIMETLGKECPNLGSDDIAKIVSEVRDSFEFNDAMSKIRSVTELVLKKYKN